MLTFPLPELDVTDVIVIVPFWFDTVKVPDAPVNVVDAPLAGSDNPTAANEADTTLADRVTVVVVLVTPFVVVVVVVTPAPEPPITIAVSALTAGGGVVVDPATVVPLG